jgi:hypothetical protein
VVVMVSGIIRVKKCIRYKPRIEAEAKEEKKELVSASHKAWSR